MSDEGGEGFNPCECIWSHEMAMRRLLNVLRNTQSVCTDTECFETGTPPSLTNTNIEQDNVVLMTVLFIAALCLFYFRPRPQETKGSTKPNHGNDFNGAPPAPPPALD